MYININKFKALVTFGLITFLSSAAHSQSSGSNCVELVNSLIQNPHALDSHAVTPRDYQLDLKESFESRTPKELTAMRKWVKENTDEDGYLDLRHTRFHDADEYVIYNWQDADINWTNLTRGIHPDDLKELLRKKDHSHLGIYGMSEPVSAAYFGEIPIEIAIYKNRYPHDLGGGNIEWRNMKGWQFRVDPTRQAGAGNYFLFGRGTDFNTQSYLIEDLRVIKQIRFVNKKKVVAQWAKLDFSSEKIEKDFVKFAEQWLITPNYSLEEMTAIARHNPRLFNEYIRYRNKFGSSKLEFQRVSADSINVNGLRLNGLFRVLFQEEGNLVDLGSVNFEYQKLAEAYRRLTPQQKDAIRDISETLSESRLSHTLRLFSSESSGEFEANKSELLTLIRSQDKDLRGYYAYRKDNFEREVSALEKLGFEDIL